VDLGQRSREGLVAHFGRTGAWFYEIARGNDPRPVEPFRARVSLGIEDTFPRDLVGVDACSRELESLSARLEDRLSRANFSGYTLTLKIKFSDFTLMTRARTRDCVFANAPEIFKVARVLLEENLPPKKPVRLLGLTVSHAAPVVPENGAKEKFFRQNSGAKNRHDASQMFLPLDFS